MPFRGFGSWCTIAGAGVVATVLGGCTTVETQSFRTTGNTAVDSAYVATDADFSQYDRLLVDEMGIFFPDHAGLSAGELDRIRQIFRRSFSARLSGYDITREPGPDMLRVTASLVDLREAEYADVSNLRRDLRDIALPGKLLFLMELRDSGNDRVLARAADSQVAPRFSTGSGGSTDWRAVEEAADHWAGLFRNFLDQNLGP